ncbi:MAG: hypothetical protein WBG48_00840, partial [Pricia sp.]
FKFVLKNQSNNTLATKVPIEGDLSDVGTKIWPTVTNIFQNAWIKAFQGIVDDDIDFEDAEAGADEMEMKETRKEARQEWRAERKRQREERDKNDPF